MKDKILDTLAALFFLSIFAFVVLTYAWGYGCQLG